VRPASDGLPEEVAENRHVLAKIGGAPVMGTLVRCTYYAIVEGAHGAVEYYWEWEGGYFGNGASILSPRYLESDHAIIALWVEDSLENQDYADFVVFIESAWEGECNP